MTPSFDIAGIRVAADAPTFIVAELSANHGGSLDIARRTVEAASKAGANAIKIQTYTPDTLTLRSAAPPFVVHTKNEWAGRTLYDLYLEAMTPWEWHEPLQRTAKDLGLVFFSTPFDASATEFLCSLDVPAYKIASFELVDLPLIEHVARRGKPMILSTGMASLGEIEAAVRVCRAAGNEDLALLRCVSAYPAKPEAMNLTSLATLRTFNTVIGLSDHTRDPSVAIAAVTLGARIVEKHFILDRSVGGPDAFFSLEPGEFTQLVSAIRNTEAALGPPRFGPSTDEVASTSFRRSLFIARDIRKGATITVDDVRSVRPASGLPARHLPEILGMAASQDLAAAQPMRWEYAQSRTFSNVVLREATLDDAETLLALRNDPEVRAASVTDAVIQSKEHLAWLSATLQSDCRALYIALVDGHVLGQARIDRVSARVWEVSISLTESARGRGLSVSVLRAAESVARAKGVETLVAKIRHDNVRSLRTFKSAGYYAFVTRNEGDVELVWCERRITPYL